VSSFGAEPIDFDGGAYHGGRGDRE